MIVVVVEVEGHEVAVHEVHDEPPREVVVAWKNKLWVVERTEKKVEMEVLVWRVM